jgi:hypothetical protein
MPSSDPETSGTERDVMTSLPRTRPARRSAKRDRPARAAPGTTPPEAPDAAAATDTPARARSRAATKATGTRATGGAAKPRAASRRTTTAGTRTRAAAAPTAEPPEAVVPPAGYATAPPDPGRRGPDPFALVTTAVQATGEIAQIGATLWAQAVRSAIGRLPRP